MHFGTSRENHFTIAPGVGMKQQREVTTADPADQPLKTAVVGQRVRATRVEYSLVPKGRPRAAHFPKPSLLGTMRRAASPVVEGCTDPVIAAGWACETTLPAGNPSDRLTGLMRAANGTCYRAEAIMFSFGLLTSLVVQSAAWK